MAPVKMLRFLLAAAVLLFSPLGIAAPPTEAEVVAGLVSYYDLGNHLSSTNGTVVRVSSNPDRAGALNDEQPLQGWVSAGPLGRDQVFILTFKLPREQSLASLLVQPQVDALGASTPHLMELLVAPEGGGEIFPLGRFILSRERAWHRVTFTPRTTDTVVLRIHNAHEHLPVGIGEVVAFSPDVNAVPRYDFALKAREEPAQAPAADPISDSPRETAPPTVAKVQPTPAPAKPKPRPKPKPLTEIEGIPEVINTGLLRINGKLITLYGVEGAYEPQASKLTQFIRDREVQCKKQGVESFRCSLDGRDLSEAVLSNGAGKASNEADDALKASETSARERRVGVWQ